ncbi:11813_t:CDS:2, partial [Ambispora leptoticha]
FGTVETSFAYCHVKNPEIEINTDWPGCRGSETVPTVLRYDSDFNVISWGYPALVESPIRGKAVKKQDGKVVESFKLYLYNDIIQEKLPILPAGLSYEKAITDYLNEIYKLIYGLLLLRWPSIKPEHVKYIFNVPDNWSQHQLRILQNCIFKAGYISSLQSKNLEFAKESEAISHYSVNEITKLNLNLP